MCSQSEDYLLKPGAVEDFTTEEIYVIAYLQKELR
jgi:hypothetical protein